MKKEILMCDIANAVKHDGKIDTVAIRVIFDHDQEDGKSKCKPYFDRVQIEMCQSCWDNMMENRKQVYAYGAMGHNTYTL